MIAVDNAEKRRREDNKSEHTTAVKKLYTKHRAPGYASNTAFKSVPIQGLPPSTNPIQKKQFTAVRNSNEKRAFTRFPSKKVTETKIDVPAKLIFGLMMNATGKAEE